MNTIADFTPPSAAHVIDHLHANMPKPRRSQQAIFLLVLMALLIVLWMSEPTHLTLGLPWLILLGLFAWGTWQKRNARRVQLGIKQVYELTALRNHSRAIQTAWDLLPHLRPFPDSHVQTTMLLAMNLGALRAYESTLAALEYLLDHVQPEHPFAQMLRAQRCNALLHEDRLTDADDDLRRLARMQLTPIARAMWRAAQLHQQLKTLQFDVLIQDVQTDDPMRQMWLLGVDAGYAYGMIAAACHQAHRPHDAATWWHRATMLITPQSIVESIPETAPTLQLTPAPTLAQAMSEDQLD